MTCRVEGKVAFVCGLIDNLSYPHATPYCSSPLMNLVISQAFRFPPTRAAYSDNQQPSREKTNA
jgi:hypothetical protein